uniref:IF rod domain-containing protein n=1 Tax=Salarias fasciatus TaxID=181472 RepID=A0A672FPK4_SALFA
MELHGVHRAPRPDRLGEDRRQMLDLNRRLEAYLNRLRLLEEENALLAQEVQAARRGGRGAPALRRSLEEELRRARLEVQAAWRDRLVAELEVGRLAEELRALDLQTQLEARARAEAKAKLELGRKQLEEEQRAQVWLRGQASQLEHEMRLLVQTHQDGVARLEAELTRVTAAVPRTPAPRAERTPGLLQLGQEFSHRAGRAWREAAEAHRGRLARLEEALHQTGGRLAQAEQDRRDGRLKLRALEEEAASAQEARQRLEQAAAQQRVEHEQEIQQLHERWQDLEAEKEEMGQQMERLLLENRGLLQMKTSLGLEVATYRYFSSKPLRWKMKLWFSLLL